MSFEQLNEQLNEELERAAARADGEKAIAEGAWFVKTVTAILAGIVIVAATGVLVMTCIAVVKGIGWVIGL